MTARRYIIEFEQEPDKAEMEDLLALAGRLISFQHPYNKAQK